MRQRTGAEQRVVAGIGDDRAVQRGCVVRSGDGGRDPEPRMRVRCARFAAHPVQAVNRAHFDRARAQHHAALLSVQSVAPFVGDFAAQLDIRAQIIGPSDIGHRRIQMLQPFFGKLETGGEVEDRGRCAVLRLLARDHPAIGKAAPIEIARDAVFDWSALTPAAQKIGVERMGALAVGDGALRRLQRLRQHLPAEHPPDAIGLRRSGEHIGGALFDGEQADQAGDELCIRGGISHGARPCLRATFPSSRACAKPGRAWAGFGVASAAASGRERQG